MKNILLIFSLFLSLSSINLFAQNPSSVGQNSNTNDGLYSKSASTIHGTIHINLPKNIYSGDMISGTVRTEPEGNNERKKNNASKQLEEYSISLGDYVWNSNSSPQQWKIPENSKGETITAKVLDAKGNEVTSFPVFINPNERAGTPSFSGIKKTKYLRAGYINNFQGDFDGNSSNTSITLNNTPLDILAESPDGIICAIPETISGTSTLTIEENGSQYSESYNVVRLNIIADKYDLIKGESTTVHVKVVGTKNIDTPVNFIIENLTPTNVNLQGGDYQEISINPDDLNLEGNYQKDFRLTAKRSGGFSISCILLSPPIKDTDENEDTTTIETPTDNLPGLTNPNPYPDSLPIVSSEYEISPQGVPNIINYVIDAGINLNFSIDVPVEDIKKERNKARGIPADTKLEPNDPDNRDAPYSRPVPTGIKTPKNDKGSTWSDADKLLKEAKAEVKRANDHTGPIKPGIPGFGTIGIPSPAKTIVTTTAAGKKCTEYVYYFYQRYSYINDRTLLHEEQLSPSFEFFIAEGKSKIDVTETETGWEVSATASASKGPVEVEVSGKYWEKTTKIKGKGSSSLKGRTLWLFHVGRLYLVRKAFLRIEYEYHYEVCSDGTTRNWVNTSYTDNWAYWYEWQEELFVASKDDEGNFHRVKAFPSTIHTEKQGGETESYEVDSLDKKSFDSPSNWDFFPNK